MARLLPVVVNCRERSTTARIPREAAVTHRDDGGERNAKLKALLRSSLIVFASLQCAREIQRHLGPIVNR